MNAGLQRALLGATALALLAPLTGCSDPDHSRSAAPPTILFFVLDTVRSDHLALCGYERPTSPQLERLAREPGAVSTCNAYAPGDWTLPSHASFFTGRPVTEHGARIATDGPMLAKVQVSPLAESFSTLAEQLAEKGYQTVAVSGNPVLAEASGLMQGFDAWNAAFDFGLLFGRPLAERVEETLRWNVDPDGGPLFLFVNIADAHGPWRRVPESLGWIPPRDSLRMFLHHEDSPYRRYVRGELDDADAQRARDHFVDAYDYGVYRADHTLGRILRRLSAAGWLDGPHRIVVTSDHGEFLAERGLIGHGGYLFEPNNRIPLVYFDSEGRAPSLTEPLSGLTPFYLARDGQLPPAEDPVAVAFPNIRMLQLLGEDLERYDETSVGLWRDGEKWLWTDGELNRFDLTSDPEEKRPLPVEQDAAPERLQQALEALADLNNRSFESDDELLESLQALGYVE